MEETDTEESFNHFQIGGLIMELRSSWGCGKSTMYVCAIHPLSALSSCLPNFHKPLRQSFQDWSVNDYILGTNEKWHKLANSSSKKGAMQLVRDVPYLKALYTHKREKDSPLLRVKL